MREFILHFGQDDGALADIADAMRGEFVVAEELTHGVVLPACARAVVPDGGRRRDVNVGGRFDARDAAQAVADDLDLGFELRFVGQLLEVAAAAATEVRAGRFDAHGRRLDDLDHRGEDDFAAHALDAHAHAITGCGQRDEERVTGGVRQPRAARHDALDLDFETIANDQRAFDAWRIRARSLPLLLLLWSLPFHVWELSRAR